MDPEDSQISILSDPYFSDDQVAAFNRLFDIDPKMWFIHAMTTDRKEVLVFRGSHPNLLSDFFSRAAGQPDKDAEPLPRVASRAGHATPDQRREAIEGAVASNGLSGFVPSAFGREVFEKWISGEHSTDQAVEAIKAHYRKANADPALDSDFEARANLLQITDSGLLRQFEADVTTIRMAELLLGSN